MVSLEECYFYIMDAVIRLNAIDKQSIKLD